LRQEASDVQRAAMKLLKPDLELQDGQKIHVQL